jgi:hypothetical protein
LQRGCAKPGGAAERIDPLEQILLSSDLCFRRSRVEPDGLCVCDHVQELRVADRVPVRIDQLVG